MTTSDLGQVLNSPSFESTLSSLKAFAKQHLLALLACLLVSVAALSVLIGPTSVSLDAVGNAVLSMFGVETSLSLRDQTVLFDIRLPRTVLAALIGAGLAVSGAMMQGLFRNPLADPGIVGVSAGAALAAVAVIVLSAYLPLWLLDITGGFLLPLAAFGGGLLTTLILYRIASRGGETSIATMLLAGIALGAIAGALTGILVFQSTDEQLRDFTFWSMGSLGAATWTRVISILPFITALLVAIPLLSRGLNALLLGDAEAFHLGFDRQKLKRIIILVVAAATGASVAAAGAIGFVGIVVPHVLRLIQGPDHRSLLPACALLGAVLLIGADLISRSIVPPTELPIGIVTAVLGAPVFLSILLGRRALFH